MKVLALVAILFGFNNSFAAETCREIKDNVKVFCQVLDNSCDHVESCLIRRDSCFERGEPKDEQSCAQADECAQSIKDQVPSFGKCVYKWVTSTDEPYCGVKGILFNSEDGCPGEISGLLNAFAYGLSSTVDDKFNCEAVSNKYKKKEQSCRKAIAQFKAGCLIADEDRQYVREYEPQACAVVNEFGRHPKGHYAVSTEGSLRPVDQHNSSRDIHSRQKKLPKSPEYGNSGDESGSQTR